MKLFVLKSFSRQDVTIIQAENKKEAWDILVEKEKTMNQEKYLFSFNREEEHLKEISLDEAGILFYHAP